jgi:hypothetical protein
MRNERGRPDDARGVAAFGQSLDGRRKQREKELGRGRLVHKHLEQHSHVARSVGTLHGWWAVPALRLRLLRQCLGRPAAAGAIVHPDIFGALADQAALGFAAQEAAQEAMLPVLTPDHYARSRRRLPLKFFGVQLGPDAVSRSWRWARRTNFVLLILLVLVVLLDLLVLLAFLFLVPRFVVLCVIVTRSTSVETNECRVSEPSAAL